MDRRDFIKSGLLAATVGTVSGTKAIAKEAEKQAVREQLAKDILNYNPQMQYRPMGCTGVNVSALGFGMLRLPMKDGHVDFDQTTPMVRRAIEGGVNYIDTGASISVERVSRQLAKPSPEAGATGYMSRPRCRGGRCSRQTTSRSSSISRAVLSARMSSTSTTST